MMNIPPFKKGQLLLCIGGRTSETLVTGQEYLAVEDQEEGIFSDRPFITVEVGVNNLHCCHASRFLPTKATFQCSDGLVLQWDVKTRTWSDGDLVFETTLDRGIWPLNSYVKVEGDFVDK